MRHLLLALSFVPWSAPLAFAQAVHLVGPGGHAQISSALAVAAPGDVIHVAPGAYAFFTASVGVTIRAQIPGSVSVGIDPALVNPGCLPCYFSDGHTVFSPPVTGPALHVVGIVFRPDQTLISNVTYYARVSVLSGRVTFENCDFGSARWSGLRVDGATVHLQDCTVTSFARNLGNQTDALLATNAVITAVACSFASRIVIGLENGAAGASFSNSLFHGAHVSFAGNASAPALRAMNSQIWIRNGSFTAASSGSGPRCAVEADAMLTQLDQCTFVSAIGPCATFAAPTPLLAAQLLAPVLPGMPATVRFDGAPNGFVAVFVGFALGTVDYGSMLVQPSWLVSSTSFLLGIVPTDPVGTGSGTWQIPADPSLRGLPLWWKGVQGTSLPLQVSPPVGGLIR